MTMTSC